jgi:peptidoglycan/xylan/chitin deacetylase (PgdA/CDA1 family)
VGARATFFVVGEQVERRPELLRRMAREGHEIALHGYRHRLQLCRGARALREDVERGLEAIDRATGVRPRLHRPPYGIYSGAGLAATRAAGLEPLLWSRWGKDWRALTTPERIARRVLAQLRSGDVILLHDADFYSARGSHRRTIAALEIIMNDLTRRKIGTVLPV